MPRTWKAIHFPKRHAMTGQGDKRACKWCGGGMEGKKRNAVFCCVKCIKKSYRRDNAERLSEYQREYRRANAARKAEYQREYHQANRERIIERQREYYRDNAERIAEYQREYYRDNAERLSEYQREYLNNQSAAASALYLAHTVSQFTADPPNRNVTPAQDKTP